MKPFKLVHHEQGGEGQVCWRGCQGAFIQGLTSPEVVWILLSIQWEAMDDFSAGGNTI